MPGGLYLGLAPPLEYLRRELNGMNPVPDKVWGSGCGLWRLGTVWAWRALCGPRCREGKYKQGDIRVRIIKDSINHIQT